MKKLLTFFTPTKIAILSLLMVSMFLRCYLFINSAQLIKEFKNQNYKELYSMDSLQVSSRLNSLSTVINWVCLEGSISDQVFYKMQKGNCDTGLLQQQQYFYIPQANNTKISFTLRLPKEVEYFFLIFLICQGLLILALIHSTKRVEVEKNINDVKINKIAMQVSHDIRSPLATLNTIVDSIDSISREEQSLLRESVARINYISNNLLKNSQTDNIVTIPLPLNQITNINNVLKEIINEKKVEFSKNIHVKISLELPTENHNVLLDSYEFKRCISNLINNSIEARQPYSVLNLNIKLINPRKDEIEIIIKDDGVGIPKEIMHDLGKKEITSKFTGNGLGLIHTFESINNWGGNVKIDSSLNQGTSITIKLPSIENKVELSILLDDDELVRLTWESMAKKHNQSLKTFSSFDSLLIDLKSINKTSIFYIDSNLGENIKGEEIALKLFNMGFTNLTLTTGYEAEKFSDLFFLKKVKDKSPPWN